MRHERFGVSVGRRPSTLPWFLVAGLLLFSAFTPTRVRATPLPPPDLGTAGASSQMTVDGLVEVHDARLHVNCRTARTRARCVVTLRFEAVAVMPSSIHLPPTLGDWRVDGEDVPEDLDALRLASGERRVLRLHMRRGLWEDRSSGRFLMAEAMMTRHAWLGEFEDIDRSGNLDELPLFAGAGWQLVGDVRVRHDHSRRISVRVAEQPMPTRVEARLSHLPQKVDVYLESPRETPRWLGAAARC
jgi:hypothetical protein